MTPDVALILLAHADGTVGIMHFVLNDHHGIVQVATDANVQREIDRSAYDSPVVSWRRMDRSEIPADRTFRNAWVDGGKSVSVDMNKAREIHRDRLREARAPLLAELDTTQLRAIVAEDKATVSDLETQKQSLRDVTGDAAIDAAQTTEELKAVWPEVLPSANPSAVKN